MRILIDLYHPAHLHLFRHFACEMEKRGHTIFWATRNKDVVIELLRKYQFSYSVLTDAQQGIVNLARELIEHDVKIFKIVREFKPDLMLGTSVSIAHVGRITRAKSIVFNEDDRHAVKLFAYLSYPFAHTICTPDCVPDVLGRRHVVYNGYHELAYLHPNRFVPNSETLRDVGLTEGEPFFVVRFVALEASHDIGKSGLSMDIRRKLIRLLESHGRVLITSERKLASEFEPFQMPVSPEKLHDLLYYATMCVADSQTITAEAAVLGTPAIRSNSFVRKISYLEELEHTYGLTYGFQVDKQREMLETIQALLKDGKLKEKWREKKERMLQDKIDVTDWMVTFIENYPETFVEYKRSRVNRE